MINCNVGCFELLECFTKFGMTVLVATNLTTERFRYSKEIALPSFAPAGAMGMSKEIATIIEELNPCLKGWDLLFIFIHFH